MQNGIFLLHRRTQFSVNGMHNFVHEIFWHGMAVALTKYMKIVKNKQ